MPNSPAPPLLRKLSDPSMPPSILQLRMLLPVSLLPPHHMAPPPALGDSSGSHTLLDQPPQLRDKHHWDQPLHRAAGQPQHHALPEPLAHHPVHPREVHSMMDSPGLDHGEFDNFSLDMILADMDFEAAYNMFTGIQQSNAHKAIEELQQQQAETLALHFRHTPTATIPRDNSPDTAPGWALQPPRAQQAAALPHTPVLLLFGHVAAAPVRLAQEAKVLDEHRLQILQGLKPTPHQVLRPHSPPLHFDNLLSSRELQVIELFLDSLEMAVPQLTSDATTMDRTPLIHDQINEAFSYDGRGQFRPMYPVYTSGEGHPNARPVVHVDHLTAEHATLAFVYGDGLPHYRRQLEPFPVNGKRMRLTLPPAKRKRAPRKTVILAEQKRENHTESEKKRRLMIKTAFDSMVALVNELEMGNQVVEDESDKKKKPLRFDVLSNVVRELEMLEKVNRELRQRAGG